MSTWVALEPLSVQVEAGGEAEASLRIRNTSDIVEEYHVDVVGDPARWCTAEPATLRLYPGTTGTVRLTFAPEKGPDPAAGPHPYGARVRPVEAPDAVTVPEGSVVVAPFTDLRAELVPVIVKGWLRTKPWLAVDNYGNTTVTASMRASVQDNSVDFDTLTPSFQVPPGRAHFGRFTGRPHRVLWGGHKVRHPFTANVLPTGGAAINTNGTYLQTALFPTWLTRLLALLIPLIIAFIVLWLMAKPTVRTALTHSPSAAAPASNSSAAPATAQAASPTPAQAAPATTQPAAAAPAGNGLPQPIGSWPLTDGTGGAAPSAKDTTGAHPLTGQNTTWCPAGGCGWFNDGQNAAFTSSGPVLNTASGQSFTVTARVLLQTVPANGGFATAVSQDGATATDGNVLSGFFLQYDGADQSWSFSLGAVKAESSGGSAQAGTWVNLTGVYDGSSNTATLYVNGAPAGTAPSASPYASNGSLAVGRAQYQNASTDWWSGGIKNVEAFSSALTAGQVQTLYQQTNS